MQKIIVWALLVLFNTSTISYAQTIVVVFGNGVANDKQKVAYSLGKLKEVIQADPQFDGFELEFEYAYNQTSCISGDGIGPDFGCLLDIWEAVRQITTSIDAEEFWAYLAQVRSEPKEEFELLTKTANSTASMLPVDVSLRFEDLAKQVILYQDTIKAGKKVVLVAHSQGNLFGRDAYSFLTATEQASFGMVSVATPDNEVIGESNPSIAPYTTLCEDPIHTVTPGFGPNLTNLTIGCGVNDSSTPPVQNWLFHDFISSYIAPNTNSNAQIKSDIKSVLSKLTNIVTPPVVFTDVLNRTVISTFTPIYEATGYGFRRTERFTNISNSPVRLDSIQFIYLDPADVGIPDASAESFPAIQSAAESLYPDFDFWGSSWWDHDPPDTVTWTNSMTTRDLGNIVLQPGAYIDIEHTPINNLMPECTPDYCVRKDSELVVGFKFTGSTSSPQ